MARYTGAYSGLVRRLDEVRTMQQEARRVSNKIPTQRNLSLANALCRSGVVLLSSHTEGYIQDLGEIILDRVAVQRLHKNRLGSSFRYHLSRDLVQDLKRTEEPSRLAGKIERLFERDGHIWDSYPNFYEALPADIFLSDFGNPTPERIKKFFNRFGYTQYEHDLAKRLTRDYKACSNMLDQVVRQRNQIAHGDAVIAGTPSELGLMLNLVQRYCREADYIVGNWFREQNYSIR